MKISEMVQIQIQDLVRVGAIPRYLIMTPRAFDVLLTEMEKDLGAMDQTRADGIVVYKNLEIVLGDLPRFTPICVVANVHQELDIYRLKVAKQGTPEV